MIVERKILIVVHFWENDRSLPTFRLWQFTME